MSGQGDILSAWGIVIFALLSSAGIFCSHRFALEKLFLIIPRLAIAGLFVTYNLTALDIHMRTSISRRTFLTLFIAEAFVFFFTNYVAAKVVRDASIRNME